MIIYHIWVYYLNRFLAVFTIAMFLIIDFSLIAINLKLFAKIDLTALNLFF